MRRRFSLQGPYLTLQACLNAERADRINKLLDNGVRVFGDDGPDTEGRWYEIDEALEPHAQGIVVRTKCGQNIRIFSFDATERRLKLFDQQNTSIP